MRFLKPLLFACICLLICEEAFAQRSKSGRSRSSRSFKAPKVRGKKASTVCPVFESSKYPYHGLGFKFGDPFALTYKFYPNKRLSVALDFGKASSGLYNRYFREKFETQYALEDADTLSGDARLSYSTHQVRPDLIGEMKLLYHIDAGKISPGLQVYLGGGWEWKSTHINYGYFYDRTISGMETNDFRLVDRHRVTMGPQAVLGIEYAYFQIPISAFMEIEYFTDIQADPGWRRFEGGVGLRYIF